jgi:acetolactate synthase-1/2/3 large subunit
MSQSVAARYLAALSGRGIETLFVNAGTDFAPIVEAYAHNKEVGGETFPTPVVCGHENLAAGMAHGAYLVSGRPQAVMFHVSVGTANAICAVTNAARDRVPMLVTAGRSPILEHGALGARDMSIHWAQEMFDQAGMVRELVKWDYELRDGRQVDDVVDRALSLAMTHPRSPVYLSLPREVLAATWDGEPVALPATPVSDVVQPEPSAVRELAERLAAAAFPVIVVSASGADRGGVDVLADCCSRFAIAVSDNAPRYLNIAADHPHHLGTDLPRALDQADVVLFVECDVPWIPTRAAPGVDAYVAQAGVDPLYARYPMRTHRADLTISATPKALFEALTAALERCAGTIDPGRGDRIRAAASAAAAEVDRLRQRDAAGNGPITKTAISAALGDALEPEDIVFNEYWAAPELLRRTVPGSYFYLPPAGGLGWALPAALGAKHVRPDRTVVAAVGDGAYVFANPAACHHASAKHGLPVLTIVADNASWGAVDLATRSVYPSGRAVAAAEDRFSDLSPAPDYAAYCRASGGHGEHVTDRGRLAPAIAEALDVVRRQGRQALLDVRCA